MPPTNKKPEKKPERAGKESGNDYIYLTIVMTYLTLAIGTFWHDPILHSLIAIFNGWELDGYKSGLMIGSTSAIANAASSTFSYWIFYMFPALVIFLLIIIVTIIRQDRILMVGGIILFSLNIPSLNPEITGSDAYNAVQLLVSRGWSEFSATTLHYIIFLLMLAVWGIYLYIVTENNPKDAMGRMKNIIH